MSGKAPRIPLSVPFLIVALLLALGAVRADALSVPLTVKENADAGARRYPVTAVVPLPQGQFKDPSLLGLGSVPSQVEAIERWPGDNSLRHVLVHFQATLPAHGDTVFHLTEATPIKPAAPVEVIESPTNVTVTTGPLKFIVSRYSFNILDQVWFDGNSDGVFARNEQAILSHANNGGVFSPRSGAGSVQYDSARRDPRVTVEERGPMRAVIRVDVPAVFTSTAKHLHGFAVRIYAYAGKPFIKIDYQLQNSAKNVVRSWPLYFESMDLDFRLNLAGATDVLYGIGGGKTFQAPGPSYIAQEMHNRFRICQLPGNAALYESGIMANGTGPEGFVDVRDASRGIAAMIRNFWQMWPNGLQVDGANKLSIQLFPHWSAQWTDGALSPSGLYWLDDMQHVYKETLLYFHGPSTSTEELSGLARTFQFPPTASVPTRWHRQARATLDLGGIIPPDSVIPSAQDQRQPTYRTEGFNPEDWYNETCPYYGAGWGNFWDPEPGYRTISCVTGGWPYSGARFVASGSPSDYFEAEGHGQGELNLRGEWMARYKHDKDWNLLRLSENAYCNGRWRIYEGTGVSKLTRPPLPDTGNDQPVYCARDDQHGWFYHVAESYFATGNPWIRDWYRFIGEFRRVRLDRLDPFPDTCSRATGHSLNHVLQAYRVTGDGSLLTRFRNHLRTQLRPDQDRLYGDQSVLVEPGGGGFQTGYLMRAVIDYLEEM
ncbi:MAG: hypothetical protein ACLGPL_08495, partial [Acidobacteriota bacterium]